MKFDMSIFLKSVEIQILLKLTKLTSTLHEDQNTFWIISHSVLPRMKNVSDKRCRENQKHTGHK